MSYMPPPFPFPEAWPQLSRTPQDTWLVPSTPFALPPQWPPFNVPFAYTAATGGGGGGAGASVVPPGAFFFQHTPAVAATVARTTASIAPDSMQRGQEDVSEDEGSDDDGEFEFGFVLSDEWRGRFRASQHARHHRLQQGERPQAQPHSRRQRQQARTNQKQRRKQPWVANVSDLRVRDLQHELAAAAQRESATRTVIPVTKQTDGDGRTAKEDVRRLEAQLNVRFDAFCDTFAPVVWPHD